MSFQVGIGSLGETVFFQVGLCTPLQTMNTHYGSENEYLSLKAVSRGMFVLNDRVNLKVFVIIDNFAELSGFLVDTSYQGSYYKKMTDFELDEKVSSFQTLSLLIKCS